MIKDKQHIKKIAVMDGKYYESNIIRSIQETDKTIELETNKEYITIPKNAISRIEYYRGDAVARKTYKKHQ